MDLDAYSAAHSAEWQKFAALGKKRRLSGPDSDALIAGYQSGASQLSAMKTTAGQSAEGEMLSLSLSRARLRFTGTRSNILSQLPLFFAYQLPGALFRIRWLCLAVALATAIVAVIYGVWAVNTPGVLATFGTDSQRAQFASKDFVDYYSNNAPSSFTGQVWTNNAFLAARCVAFGVIGVYAPVLLFQNAQNIGVSAALMGAHDRLDIFFLYIAPHGQLELYSIFTAGAAGLAIFWAWVAPGARSRAQSLAEGARSLFTVAVGLIGALLVSGIIEGFVTRQPWPWVVKIGIGSVALGGFLYYQWVVGRKAARAGQTGDLEEFEAGAKQLIAG